MTSFYKLKTCLNKVKYWTFYSPIAVAARSNALACWNCGFKYSRGHSRLYLV